MKNLSLELNLVVKKKHISVRQVIMLITNRAEPKINSNNRMHPLIYLIL